MPRNPYLPKEEVKTIRIIKLVSEAQIKTLNLPDGVSLNQYFSPIIDDVFEAVKPQTLSTENESGQV